MEYQLLTNRLYASSFLAYIRYIFQILIIYFKKYVDDDERIVF